MENEFWELATNKEEPKVVWETKEPKDCDEGLIDRVLTAATNVHRHLGPGLNESVYEAALMLELAVMGVSAKRQVQVPVWYRGQKLDLAFQADYNVKKVSQCFFAGYFPFPHFPFS